jgi:CO/xanthine dehydrogenase Mo-binding subunit
MKPSDARGFCSKQRAGNSECRCAHIDYPDKEINQLGARGIGEIGLAGIAAAITAATYHATGIRVRELPDTIEDLLKSPSWPNE